MVQIPGLIMKLMPLEKEVKSCIETKEAPFREAMKISFILLFLR